MVTLTKVQSDAGSGVIDPPVRLNSLDYRKWEPGPLSTLNGEKLRNNGITEYRDLNGLKTEGYEVISHKRIPETTLKLQRYGRVGATVGAVILNAVAAVGLLYSGAKLFFNTITNNDVDDSYKSLGNAYSASAVAGALTGAAHESPEWALGNIGMGMFSRYLENIWGLAGFSLSEGLASIGMGKVRYRDNKNVYAVKNSIFNSPTFSGFSFLMPIEQAVITFVKRFVTLGDWKRVKTEEPYSLFQTAGGGLISAGGVLGLSSLFKNKMSEKLQSFFYLPYSIFSLLNLAAFYRDGDVVLTRAKDFGSKKAGETYSMRMEGYLKRVASPLLALNNFFLALKGIGIDTSGGVMYNLAMAVRSWGAAVAFLAFKAQSLIKFFKPDMFGPQFKEVIKIKLNPIKEAGRLFSHLEQIETHRPPMHVSDKFDAIIYDGDNEQRDILHTLINTKTFQSLKYKTQIGLPSPSQPGENNRHYLERFSHSKRVCAIAILIYNSLLKNTKDEKLKSNLLDHKDSFKIAALLHDIGHIARSHLAEKAVKGHNNDEYTIDILKDPNSDICQSITNYYGREKGEKIIKQVRDIIGKWSPLFKAFKIADYTEYLRCGDFSSISGFPRWSLDEVKEYVDTVRLFTDKNGELRVGFTEKGAIITFINLYDRKIFNDSYNQTPLHDVEEIPYLLGLDAADVSSDEVKKMTEEQVDNAVKEGIKSISGSNFQFRIKHVTGGETAYSGYSRNDPERKIYIVFDNDHEPMEFIDYLEKVVKNKDKALYMELLPRVVELTTPKEIDVTVNVSGLLPS